MATTARVAAEADVATASVLNRRDAARATGAMRFTRK
jgi:hypothetical protein